MPGASSGLAASGVARGYLNQPQLTRRSASCADPWQPGGRIYRTGDLAVMERPTAACAAIGRTDNQIKLRGHRIELGEIEAALRAAAGVSAGSGRAA